MKRTKNAFTLVEVLIVVVIMGILAATVVPTFVSTTDNTAQETRDFIAKNIQSQLAIYRAQHNGKFPNSVEQMTHATNAAGTTTATPSAAFPFGPYFDEFPTNPVNGSNTVIGDSDAVRGSPSKYGWTINSKRQIFGNDKPLASQGGR